MSCEQCANINMLIYRMNLNSTASAVLRLFDDMIQIFESDLNLNSTASAVLRLRLTRLVRVSQKNLNSTASAVLRLP